MQRLIIRKTAIHFWMVKSTSHLFKRYPNWKKEPRDYQLLKRYDVVQIENTVKLIYSVDEGNSSIKYYVRKEDILVWYMMLICQSVMVDVTAESIIYLSLCVPWLKKSKLPEKGLVIKPIMIFSEMNSRAQVDLSDMQSQPDVDLKWILVY